MPESLEADVAALQEWAIYSTAGQVEREAFKAQESKWMSMGADGEYINSANNISLNEPYRRYRIVA